VLLKPDALVHRDAERRVGGPGVRQRRQVQGHDLRALGRADDDLILLPGALAEPLRVVQQVNLQLRAQGLAVGFGRARGFFGLRPFESIRDVVVGREFGDGGPCYPVVAGDLAG